MSKDNYIVINGKKAELTEEQLKALGIKEPKKELFEEGKNIWVLAHDGVIDEVILDTKTHKGMLVLCKKIYEQGNLFFTKEEAEFERDRRKYYYQVKRYLDEHNDKIDWRDCEQTKFTIGYDTISLEIFFDRCWVGKGTHNLYATSKEIMQQAIILIGEENFKKYILEV